MREELSNTWRSATLHILLLVAVLWLIEGLNSLTGQRLDVFGIYPRTLPGLLGIPFWTLLHGGIAHLAVNTTPLAILGWCVALRGGATLWRVSVLVTLIGGAAVWVVGRFAYHIGSSALVFGHFGFLVAMGIYEQSLRSLLLGTFALFFYGGLIFGILPSHGFISWEGHLAGLLVGIGAARYESRATPSSGSPRQSRSR